MRILGIDYGTKRVGVAIGETGSKVAVPLKVLRIMNHESGIMDIVELVKREGVELVVVGQGGKGPMEAKVQEFVKKLQEFVRVEIADEHFTTAQIEKIMKNYGKERWHIDKDSAAAALILQDWLEVHTNQRT